MRPCFVCCLGNFEIAASSMTSEASTSGSNPFLGSLFGSIGLILDFDAQRNSLVSSSPLSIPSKPVSRQHAHQSNHSHPSSSARTHPQRQGPISRLLRRPNQQHQPAPGELQSRLGQLHPVSHSRSLPLAAPRLAPPRVYAKERLAKAVKKSLKPKVMTYYFCSLTVVLPLCINSCTCTGQKVSVGAFKFQLHLQ